MTPTLRPMNLGEILDRTFEIYRKRFPVFVGLAAMPAVAMLGVHLIDIRWLNVSNLAHPAWRPGEFMWAFVLSLAFGQVRAILEIPFVPAMVSLASKADRGEQDSVLGSLRVFAARWRSYVWIGILMLVAELVIPEIVAFFAMLAFAGIGEITGYLDAHPYSPVITVLVFVVPAAILIALLLWLGACFSLAFPAAVFEQSVGLKAMRRSWTLSKNSRGRIVAVWVTISILYWALILGFRSLYRWVWISTHAWRHLGSAWRIIYLAGIYTVDAVVIALLGSLLPIAITLFYYDQRIRHEGYDIEEMMKSAGLSESGLSQPEAAAGALNSVEAQAQESQA